MSLIHPTTQQYCSICNLHYSTAIQAEAHKHPHFATHVLINNRSAINDLYRKPNITKP